MKKCYQIIYKLTDGTEHDVIFENQQKAYIMLFRCYKVGQEALNKKITASSVVERIIF